MRISVVIPTLNEAGGIGHVIEQTRRLGDCEIVVVDGGSDDDTLQRAAAADHVLTSSRGRAAQQNAGAAAASAEVLLFLHADCWLEPGALQAVRMALHDQRNVAGCFRQTIEARGFRYRLLEQGNAWRVRLLKWAYGDQAIFVRRSAFERVGGFPDVPLMEDLLLIKKLKRIGRIRLLGHRLRVSARRWQRVGMLRQTLRNWRLLLLAHAGVSPDRLARRYPPVR